MPKYQNLIIYYFSGIGNARSAALWMAQTARERGLNTQVINIDRFAKVEIPVVLGKTLIGFCSATHGFNLPPLMLEFINKFPKNKIDADVFILNTRGGMKLYKLFTPGLSGVAQYLPAIILLLKGYTIAGMQPMDLPSNWISLHPGIRTKVVESIYHRCKRISINTIDKLLNGEKVFTAFWSLPFDLAIAPIALGYYLIGRFILAKTFVATSACTDCGLCRKQCPVKAIIKVDKRMFWTRKCESCMRCMNNCPERAIETAHGLTALALFLASLIIGFLYNYIFIKQLSNDPKYYWLDSFYSWILEPVITLLIVFAIYKVAHYFMRFKLIDRLITYTSLTKFKFWRRYKPKVKI